MRKGNLWKMGAIGFAAGCVNGLLGTGGGMILVPLLTLVNDKEDANVFAQSVAIILPICVVSMAMSPGFAALPWKQALPDLIAGIPGGIAAGIWGRKIPVKWLHRVLGILILWGGMRYLC